MDPLTDVLDLTRVHGTVTSTLEAGEEWGVDIDHIPGAFHAMIAGAVWLELDGHAPLHLRPGDLVLLPNGPRHRLVATPGAASEPFDLIAAKQAMTTGGTMSLGTGEAHTKVLCGSYQEDTTLNASLLGLLPSLIHLGPDPARPTGQILHLITYESSTSQAGAATVLDRLLDVLIVHVIRDWLATDEAQSLPASWLTALRDPFISKALTTLHGDIARDWTLPDLATELAVSRATLLRRFQALVGQSPLAYLTKWRMQLAAHRLRTTSDSISQIARSVGYTSEYAFNRAFTRVLGTPPGRFRSLDRSNETDAIPASNGAAPYRDN